MGLKIEFGIEKFVSDKVSYANIFFIKGARKVFEDAKTASVKILWSEWASPKKGK